MAQYKSNFYGTSYYGDTNAFSGTYETAVILTEETLNDTFIASIKATLPDAVYTYSDEEIVRVSGNWRMSDDNAFLMAETASAKLSFVGTCDRVIIKYQGRPNGATVNVKVTTTIPGGTATEAVNTSLNTHSALNANNELVLDGLEYGHQLVEITLPAGNPSSNFFYFKSITARVCSFTIETRATDDSLIWTEYVKTTLSKAATTGNNYDITGESPSYSDKNRIQVRVWMASSDNKISPIIQELDTFAGDTTRRTEDATFIARINMESVATAIGQSFGFIRKIDWTATVPTDTDLVIRTRSTDDDSKTRWSAKSVPYKKGIKRVKLKEGKNDGFIITPLINPASVNPYLRIDQWNDWKDVSFLPPDESDVRIAYSFLDERNSILHEVNQPKYTEDKRLFNTSVANKPYRLKIYLKRRFDKATPVVDYISLSSNLIYEQDNVIENYKFSSVDNQNSGEQMILDMADLTYDIPDEATTPTYTLIDKTERPLDVSLYLDSTRTLAPSIAKSNITTLRLDKIWAKTKVNTTPKVAGSTGVPKHYQYGGGSVIYGNPDDTPMASSFTPPLVENREYRYFINSGWLDPETNTIVDGSLNANVDIYWDSEKALETEARINTTDKSSHNGIVTANLDLSSENIISEVSEEATWGEVEWISEEKVFFGACNLNDERGDYVRTHVTPESGNSVDSTYVVKSGDTYDTIAESFGIDPLDLRFSNNADLAAIPVIGETLLIPSRIVLPKINPLASVGPNPYQIEIVYNSVRQGGKVVPENRIGTPTLSIGEEEVLIEKEEVTRGNIANGVDFLKNAKVTEILGIWNIANDPVAAPNYQEDLDYQLSGNSIDWGLVGDISTEPTIGATYYVSYKCLKPRSVTIRIGSQYQEEGGIDRVWRSPEVKAFTGVCAPRIDHKAVLPEASTWQGAASPEVEDLEYIIEDNDLWVKTWISYDPAQNKFVATGSLQDRIPKDNWFPYIHTGYYYLGKDEYYLFSEPIVVEPEEKDVAKAANIDYVSGKYSNAALFQRSSKNLVKNSGFEVKSKGVVQKIRFSNPGIYEIAELGITR